MHSQKELNKNIGSCINCQILIAPSCTLSVPSSSSGTSLSILLDWGNLQPRDREKGLEKKSLVGGIISSSLKCFNKLKINRIIISDDANLFEREEADSDWGDFEVVAPDVGEDGLEAPAVSPVPHRLSPV